MDAPPLLPVTDASLLSHAVDGVIMVGTVGKSHREQMTEAVAVLERVNSHLFGVVLNKAPRKGLGNSYYGFGYANSYVGYASYYGYSKDGKKKVFFRCARSLRKFLNQILEYKGRKIGGLFSRPYIQRYSLCERISCTLHHSTNLVRRSRRVLCWRTPTFKGSRIFTE